jgi:hypothetical protein
MGVFYRRSFDDANAVMRLCDPFHTPYLKPGVIELGRFLGRVNGVGGFLFFYLFVCGEGEEGHI